MLFLKKYTWILSSSHWNTPSKNSQVKKRLWENSVFTLLQNNTPTIALEEGLWSMSYANKSRTIKRQAAVSSLFTDISETQVKTARKYGRAGSQHLEHFSGPHLPDVFLDT